MFEDFDVYGELKAAEHFAVVTHTFTASEWVTLVDYINQIKESEASAQARHDAPDDTKSPRG